MSAEQVVFFIIALVTVVAALGMVGVGSVFHAALLMILTFTGIAAFYMLLGAGFLGIIQILIYVGAIAVLMLFAIMLTPRVMNREGSTRYNRQWPVAAAAAIGLVVVLIQQVANQPWRVVDAAPGQREYAAELGRAFMTPDAYLLPFWVVAVLLLAALIGAIVIAREEG